MSKISNIKEFLKHYIIWVVVILAVLLVFKSCQSCSRKNMVEFTKQEYEQKIDSIRSIMQIYNDSIVVLNEENIILRERLESAGHTIQGLSEDKQHLRNINNILSQKNKN